MKAKELRIGNYVDVLGNIDQIQSIGSDERGEYATFKKTHNGYYLIHESEELIKPIPLTEEWLIKLGFYISDDSYSDVSGKNKYTYQEAFIGDNPITKDYLLILKNTGNGWFYRNWYFKIQYVHELQNLYFSLTKEELIISN